MQNLTAMCFLTIINTQSEDAKDGSCFSATH